MPKIKVKKLKVKICCEQMKYYVKHYWVEVNQEGNAELDTDMYEGSPVEIDYCPWCGKKIEIIEVEELEDIPEWKAPNYVPDVFLKQILASREKNLLYQKNFLSGD